MSSWHWGRMSEKSCKPGWAVPLKMVQCLKRKQKKKSQSSKPRKEEKKPAAKGEGSSGQKKKKQAFYKTTSRHRATSDAWRQAARKARKAGYSAEKVKELAKKASQKVARELDQQ